MQKRFAARLKRHRLRREIIATAITNSLINRMGPVFPVRAQDDTGADPAAIARAYSIAREVFAARYIWTQIEALDNRIPAAVQYTAMLQTTRLLRHMTYWLLENRRNDLDIERAVLRYAAKVGELFHELTGVLGVTRAGATAACCARSSSSSTCPRIWRRELPRWRCCTAHWTWSRWRWPRA